jgi:hypothetical protein
MGFPLPRPDFNGSFCQYVSAIPQYEEYALSAARLRAADVYAYRQGSLGILTLGAVGPAIQRLGKNAVFTLARKQRLLIKPI